MLFISSKNLFSFSGYSNFCITILPFFSPCQPVLQRIIEDKVYDVINCLNKNLIKYFVQYLEKEKRYDIETSSIDKLRPTFLWKNHAEKCTKS